VAHRGRQTADEALALALATGQTLRAAAQTAGVGERTATRRWTDAAFRRRVGELRGEMTARAAGRLVEGMTAAADKLRQLVDAADERVALAAAKELLAAAVRIREATELEERLAELEARAQRDKP
jgi:transposase-like protein